MPRNWSSGSTHGSRKRNVPAIRVFQPRVQAASLAGTSRRLAVSALYGREGAIASALVGVTAGKATPASSPACSTIGARTRNRALPQPLWRGRLRGSPNVRLPIPIAGFRAQGRLGQLSARSGQWLVRSQSRREPAPGPAQPDKLQGTGLLVLSPFGSG
jgi:hypothetical protein